MVVLAILALPLGFVLGWLAHRLVALNYRERWLQAVGMLNDKAIAAGDLPSVQVALPITTGQPVATVESKYIHGRWALDERQNGNGDRVSFYAIRLGFDDVPLGSANKKYAGVYEMLRSNVEQEIEEMNSRGG